MTNQTFELQAVTNEELMAAAGGLRTDIYGGADMLPLPADLLAKAHQTADNHGLQSLLMPRSRTVATIG